MFSDLQGLKIADVEFPHVFVVHHSGIRLFEPGDEKCLKNGNMDPKMDEITFVYCDYEFKMRINGQTMGKTCDKCCR